MGPETCLGGGAMDEARMDGGVVEVGDDSVGYLRETRIGIKEEEEVE